MAAIICAVVPPIGAKNWVLTLLGWDIGKYSRIGFSWILASKVSLGERSRIGSGNVIVVDGIVMAVGAKIGLLNRISGPIWVILKEQAAIGNQNRIARARRGITWGHSAFKLGEWSKLTSNHFVDCTRSVRVGSYSTFAGRDSQIWTHGYLHGPAGLERTRIDGEVRVGSNVYIGSACVITAGVSVGRNITIGAGMTIGKSITRAGLYVSEPIRWLPLDYASAVGRYSAVGVIGLCEKVVHKRIRADTE